LKRRNLKSAKACPRFQSLTNARTGRANNKTFDQARAYDLSDPFRLTWSLSVNKGESYITPTTLKETRHVFYVGVNEPSFPQARPLMISALHLGTMNLHQLTAAQQNNPESVVGKIWDAFKNRNVKKWQGYYFLNEVEQNKLRYYGNWNTNIGIEALERAGKLIAGKDGQCDAWASLFKEVLLYQGFTEQQVELKKVGPSAAGGASGFLIKNWTLPNPANQVAFAHVNIFKKAATSLGGPITSTRNPDGTVTYFYDFAAADVTDLPAGIPGQNTNNPRSAFDNHVIIHIPSLRRYYDPSYGGDPLEYPVGNPDAGLLAWENRAVAGYFVAQLGKDNAGKFGFVRWRIKADTPNVLQVEFKVA
jgi:hypothetical protein